jgi:hypothetical protein
MLDEVYIVAAEDDDGGAGKNCVPLDWIVFDAGALKPAGFTLADVRRLIAWAESVERWCQFEGKNGSRAEALAPFAALLKEAPDAHG